MAAVGVVAVDAIGVHGASWLLAPINAGDTLSFASMLAPVTTILPAGPVRQFLSGSYSTASEVLTALLEAGGEVTFLSDLVGASYMVTATGLTFGDSAAVNALLRISFRHSVSA